jgi:hypothetical protein
VSAVVLFAAYHTPKKGLRPSRRSVMNTMSNAPDNNNPTHGIEAEWLEWYQLTPLERWQESEKLWDFYLQVGGSLDPEPDSQSPFGIEPEPRSIPVNGRPGVRVIRRSGI